MSIVNEFEKIPTTCISDIMQGLNNLDPAIKPLKDEYRVAGRAFTVKMPVGDNLVVLKAIREANPGDVLVIDAKGDTYRAEKVSGKREKVIKYLDDFLLK